MTTKPLILVVDDDRDLQLEEFFQDGPYEVRRCYDCESALSILLETTGDEPDFCMAFIDIVLPIRSTDTKPNQRGGLELMKEMKSILPHIFLVPITGKGWGTESVNKPGILDSAIDLGICDYISKPLTRNEVLAVVEKALRQRQPERAEDQDDTKKLPVAFENGDIHYFLSADKQVQDRVIGKISMEGPGTAPVLIRGETGTGKELVARAIHAASGRGTFQSINCAAIPENLIESELFGFEKGTFSGADKLKKGKFEQAHGGTLFLDEVGDLSLAAQAKLLRVLQEKEVDRLGGAKPIKIDVRIVAATNQQLEALIQAGKFRDDLYYRLEGVIISIPPLRQRPVDIPLIAKHFLEILNRKEGVGRALTPDALAALSQYHWPGNVRELQNVVRNGFSNTNHDLIAEEDLPIGLKKKNTYATLFRELALAVKRDPNLSLDTLSILLAEESFRLNHYNSKAAARDLGVSVNTLNKYTRSIEEISKALFGAQFDEKRAALSLPDFGPAFVRKKIKAFLYGKSKSELASFEGRTHSPEQWRQYTQKLLSENSPN